MRLPVFATSALLAAGAAVFAQPAKAQDEVTFATNWLPEAEHGGFFQAVADGTYEAYGLDVTIIPGGPMAPNRQLLLSGRADFYMSGNLLQPLNALAQDVPPIIEVAAIFQKEPQVFLAHPGSGVETIADLAGLETIFIGNDTRVAVWEWMKANWPGFSDDQIRPYAFTPAPFLADPNSAQQGYVTSEPFTIETVGGFEPTVVMLADHGFDTPSTMIETTVAYMEANPDIVQRFVDASIVGWYTYLYGDPSAGNALIQEMNPDMSDELIAHARDQMLARGIVDSGIALEHGIGCFDDAKVASFYDAMVDAGIVAGGLELSSLYTNRFVCNGVGMDVKAEAAD